MNHLSIFHADPTRITDTLSSGMGVPELEDLIRQLDLELETLLQCEEKLRLKMLDERRANNPTSHVLAEIAQLTNEIARRFRITNLLLLQYKLLRNESAFKKRRV